MRLESQDWVSVSRLAREGFQDKRQILTLLPSPFLLHSLYNPFFSESEAFTMNIRIVLLVTLTTVTSAFADCPPPMIGELKTAVRYIPAENWSKFEDYFDAHIEFLTKQMQAGSIQIAGPFLTKDKQLNGGLTIYNYTDFPIVEAMVSQDALVKVKVVTYEINSWMECSIAKP